MKRGSGNAGATFAPESSRSLRTPAALTGYSFMTCSFSSERRPAMSDNRDRADFLADAETFARLSTAWLEEPQAVVETFASEDGNA